MVVSTRSEDIPGSGKDFPVLERIFGFWAEPEVDEPGLLVPSLPDLRKAVYVFECLRVSFPVEGTSSTAIASRCCPGMPFVGVSSLESFRKANAKGSPKRKPTSTFSSTAWSTAIG